MSISRSLVEKYLFLLDIDGNLVSVIREDGDENGLSESAEECLSKSTELLNVDLLSDSTSARSVMAICRLEWLGVFRAIIVANKRYKELNPEDSDPLITVGFLTSSNYESAEFSTVFGKLFGDDIMNQLIPPDKFKTRFFNMDDQQITCLPAITTKGLFMDKSLPAWKKAIPGLRRKNVCLIDDQIANHRCAKSYGFKAIHHPTTVSGRSRETLFSNNKEGVFSKLHDMIKKAHAACHESRPRRRHRHHHKH